MFILLLVLSGGMYVAYTLNLLGPMMQMSSAAVNQGGEIFKQKLRDFVANNETARQALALDGDSVRMDSLDSRGRKRAPRADDDDEI